MIKKIVFLLVCLAVLAIPIGADILKTDNKIVSTTYTPTSMKVCYDNGLCMVKDYMVMHYLDDKGTTIYDAPSLKNYYTWSYESNDPSFVIEVLDFNYTHITFRTNVASKEVAKAIPLTFYKEATIINGTNITNIKIESYKVNLTFASVADIKTNTVPWNFKDKIKFGTNSTVIYLNESNYGLLNDTNVGHWAPTANFGNNAYFTWREYDGSTYADHPLIRLNFSAIGTPVDIVNSTIYIYLEDMEAQCGGGLLVGFYNDTQASENWNEYTVTWNTRPNRSTNLTESYTITAQTDELSYVGYTITQTVENDLNNDDGIVNLHMAGSNVGNDCLLKWTSREGANEPYTITWYDLITGAAPLWGGNTSSSPSNYSPTTKTTFNITWVNGSANTVVNTTTVNITINNTNYTASLISGDNTTGVYGFDKVLAAGAWNWSSTAESNSSNYNTSAVWAFIINASVPSCTVGVNPASPTSYGNQTTAICTCDNPEAASSSLWLNYANVTSWFNNTATTLGVANHTIICNSSATGNYTNATDFKTYNVTAADPALDIMFNVSSPQEVGAIINVNCTVPVQVGSGNSTLWNDTTNISNPTIWNTIGLTAGTYNFTCNTTAVQNYTAGTISETFTLTNLSQVLNIPVVYDEKSLTPLTFNLSIWNDSYSETTNDITSYANNTVKGNLTIAISANGYVERNYYISVPINGSYNMTGYLLQSDEGVYIDFWAYSNTNPLGEANAIVNMSRFIGSQWIVIEQQRADFEGKGIIFLDPYAEYRINASKGALSYNQDLYSPNPDFILTMNLGGSAAGTNTSWMFSGVNYSLTATDSYLGRSSNLTVICYNISSNSDNVQWMTLNLSYWNGTSLYFNNTTTAANGTSICIAVNSTNLTGLITAQTWLKIDGYDEAGWERRYLVWYEGSSIPSALTEVQALGLSEMTEMLIAFFVCIGISIGISKSAWKTGGGIMYLLGLTFFALYGWFSWEFFLGLAMVEFGILMKDGFRGW